MSSASLIQIIIIHIFIIRDLSCQEGPDRTLIKVIGLTG